MQTTIAICEDELNIRKEIARLILSSSRDCILDVYETADALIQSGKRYDIYILDIQMPGMNGMELAENIRGNGDYPSPVIIFVTALREYMQDAFDVQAYHFLTKPIDEEKFHSVLDRAVAESRRRNRRETIGVKASGVVHTVLLDDIMFVESIGKKVAIHTLKGVLECYGKIGEISSRLEKNPAFFRSHRCYIVNMERIASFSAKAIKLTGGQEVHLAREKYQSFIKAYAQYAMK
jgi:DNA-binding LytR/AlgR family response regulator